jgi:7-cyano-7-deazaguanine synthase in queuosine biosynthesis
MSYLFQGSPGEEFDSVVLFSGGLDSLCGAVEEVVTHRRRILLVSHCSSTRVAARQEQLFEALRNCVPKARQPVRIPVTINKDGDLNQDFSQRSRSFVFAAVAAVVARLAGRDRIRFYENGVTSLNLPLSAEEVGARASRTTHPQSLARFGELFSLLFETAFTVENRYQWKTKAEMLCELREHAHLAALTCSCGHVWGKEESSPHCGKCLQCVDRRLSALAAGLSEAEDPPSDYASDPLASEREGPDLTLAERYVGIAREVAKLDSPRSFAVRFPEVNAALAYLGCSPEEAAKACYNLYQSHATGVQIALGRAFAAVGVLNWQAFPPHSLLGVVQGRTLPQGDCTKTLMI